MPKWRVQNRIAQRHDEEGGFDYLVLLTPEGLEFDPRDNYKLEPMLKADLRHTRSHCDLDVSPGCGDNIMERYQEQAAEGDDFGGVMIYHPDDGVEVVSLSQAQKMEQQEELEHVRALSIDRGVVQ